MGKQVKNFSFGGYLIFFVSALLLVCVLCGCQPVPAPTQTTAAPTQDPLWEERSREADQFIEAGEFSQAITVYTELEKGGYTEAAQLRQDAYLLWAKVLAEAGDHVGAYEKLMKIPDHPDAAPLMEQQQEAIYGEGQKLYREANYFEAEKRFLRISSYRDAKKYITLINARNYPASRELVDGLLAIFTFEDASELLLRDYDMATLFMEGVWISGEGCQLMLTEWYYYCYIPTVTHGAHLYVKDGVFSFQYKNGEAENINYTATVLTPNCILLKNQASNESYMFFRNGQTEGGYDI